MALTLAAGISASDRYCTVNQPPTQPPGSYYRIGDEVVQHIGYVTTTPIWTPNFTELYIARAQLGTTAASHLSAAALTYVRAEFLSATAETDPGPFETGGAGGGGITNTAPAGSIAVSDGTNITGSANLTWDDVGNSLGLAAAENGGGTIEAIGVGGQLFIRAHAGDVTHVGGEVSITSGASNGYNGGSISVKTGDDTGGGDAGGIVIETGFATDGASGDIDIRVDPNDLSGTGGNVLIQAGTGQTGSGGDVFISAGSAITGGSNGSVQILDGSGHSIEMNPSGMFLLGGVVILDSLPTADPVNAGQVWNDTGTLKVSAG
jgi:hypothetical protein